MQTFLKAFLMYSTSLLVVGAFLFVPSGTLDYWQAWLYMALLFSGVAFVGAYFLIKDPAFLERRFQAREKEKEQRGIQMLSIPLFIIGFLLPGLDRRLGWSSVPFEAVFAADVIVLLGYLVIFWVFRTNSWAGRTIRVEKGQKVVSTGPYAMVRHPMYVGVLMMLLATPIALGSYVALIPFVLYIPVLAMRIRNEEEVLGRELKGYRQYCGKMKWRLVPGIW